ncbi:MAG TPA: tRNA (adenosine(37)-N6)-threonylcarbamoyltransferase complex dimerization subunit type 1 TsaB [bacterium]|nr:tRNA (adenosine(37)-N6)-threonylcarbamoyltransferase complex dimerization subunit type 1 TsaB [bacterium]
MRVLALETATPIAGCAIVDSSGVLAEATLRAPMRDLEWLVPTVDELLRGWDLRPTDIEAVAVSRGPGGFTGLRIGIITAVMWARAWGVPLLGIGTLDAFAAAANTGGFVLPVLDAHRGEVAGALYSTGTDGTARGLIAPLVAFPDVLAREVIAALGSEGREATGPVLVVGDGLVRHGSTLLGALGNRARAGEPHLHPRAAAVGLLALRRLARGERDDPAGFVPIYGRRPAARPWRDSGPGQ